jgi:hypothetical protein
MIISIFMIDSRKYIDNLTKNMNQQIELEENEISFTINNIEVGYNL